MVEQIGFFKLWKEIGLREGKPTLKLHFKIDLCHILLEAEGCGKSTFVGYLMPKPSLWKDSSVTINKKD